MCVDFTPLKKLEGPRCLNSFLVVLQNISQLFQIYSLNCIFWHSSRVLFCTLSGICFYHFYVLSLFSVRDVDGPQLFVLFGSELQIFSLYFSFHLSIYHSGGRWGGGKLAFLQNPTDPQINLESLEGKS